jgi:hypothetical protein
LPTLGLQGAGRDLADDLQEFVLEDGLGFDLPGTLHFEPQPVHEALDPVDAQVRLEQEVLEFLQLVLVQVAQPQEAAHGGQHQFLGTLEPLLELAEQIAE